LLRFCGWAMSKLDYYDVLGLKKGCAATEIKASFRKLAMELHPDQNPDDHTAEVKFKAINEAYDVLTDAQKRAASDRFGHAAFEQGGGRAGGNPFDFAGSFSDIFEDLFGEFTGGKQRRRQNRGGDL